MKILGVTLSEFHDKVGLRIVASDPAQTALTNQQFSLHSNLILPRQQLCDRILALEFKEQYFLVVSPLLSINKEHDKTYKREKYIYSLSILVDKDQYLLKDNHILYKQILSKLAKYFKVIEETYHIVYENHVFIGYILSVLRHFRKEINEKGVCDLTYLCSHYTFINANRPPNLQKNNDAIITCATVPITVLAESEINKIESEFGRQLLWYAYQGTYSIRKIYKMNRDRTESDIKVFYLKAAEKGVVFLLDMINLHNCYVLTKEIQQYLPEQPKYGHLKEIAQAVCLKSQEVHPNELLNIYLQFNRVTTLYKIIENNKKILMKINIQKLIRMGQINGIIKRVQQKITYSQLPSPLIMIQPMKKLLYERQSRPEISESVLSEQINKTTELVKYCISNSLTIDEMMIHLQVDFDKLLRLLNPLNRYILQINH